ncbi:MAG: recombinase family protein, partial [Paludibacteraceae bacterium]|nr:recombinase family protein [Paludibacteraceae bacterium]
MKTAIIYARVSSTTDRQSTERQIKSLTEYAANNGYEIKKVFAEHISG